MLRTALGVRTPLHATYTNNDGRAYGPPGGQQKLAHPRTTEKWRRDPWVHRAKHAVALVQQPS
jgi:hypothetical protein